MIASVFFTIFARIVIGSLCDRFGPRLTYTGLLAIGSLPVFGLAFSKSYESFLIMRFLIGGIGAAFVITQYHTSVMFSAKVVGTANATTAGWGNLGGGVSQILMPLIFAFFIYLGFSESLSWRLGLGVLGFIMLVYSFVYYKFTKDLPYGNFKDQKLGHWDPRRIRKKKAWRLLRNTMKDRRVLVLFLIYGACFGIELTINNMAAIYFHGKCSLSLTQAGSIAGLFGIMNLFARTLGGWFGDQASSKYGIQGRVRWLGFVLFLEGLALCFFSRMDDLLFATVLLVVFSLFV